MHALGEIALRIKERYHWSLSSECLKQRLGLLEVGGIKAFGEPVIDLLQQCTGFDALTLALPQACQAHSSAEFEGFCLLLTCHVESVLKAHLGVVLLWTILTWMALSFAQKQQ